jgi:hypothetical protein
MREKVWQLVGVILTHVAVRQSHINPRTGLARCTLRKDMLDSVLEALVCLRHSLSAFRRNLSIGRGKKDRLAREFCSWLLAAGGLSQ